MVKPGDEAIRNLWSEFELKKSEITLENKKYVIVTAITSFTIINLFNIQYTLFLKCVKKYAYGMHGHIVKKFIYTDTLFRFLKHKDKKLMNQAYSFGKQNKAG